MGSNAGYAEAKFLIYSSWETVGSWGGILSGSLLLDHADTDEEALEKIEIYRTRRNNSAIQKIEKPGDKNRYCHIPNQKHWWGR